jgi:putative methionine-R-sulfoxide reductase with GAF domain/anti-sigma regulatory factor (Ser/Thr protein kinase)
VRDDPAVEWLPASAVTSVAAPVPAARRSSAWLERDDRLQDIKAVTDASLASLDLDELLPLLLDRVLDLLRCDTAAVLLYDAAANQLVAHAARGLEEEVRQGVRIPFGVGFAGRIAAERRPVVLSRVDPSTVANPILWQKGIRSMLGVPLVAGGTLIGVLHVGSYGDRAFDDDAVMLLELAADRLAAAAHANMALAERHAARMLQRSLLPANPLRHPHIDFASRYVPAERGDIGGDWYDAFELPTGEVWVMTGDVVGHGLRPAIIMGRLRSTLRAYALLRMSPEDVLRAANRKLDLFESGAMATVVCAVLAPPFDELRMCSAGHPPPVLAHPGAEPELLAPTPTPPLGVVPELEPFSTRWKLEDRSMLVFYTDGLVERRGEPITDGIERLRAAVHSAAPERLCAQIMDTMIGGYQPADDVALLALRVRPRQQRSVRPHVEAEPLLARSELFACEAESVGGARRFITECVAQLGLQSLPEVQLMVSELATNSIKHSCSRFDVTVERLGEGKVRVEVRDFGPGVPELPEAGSDADGGRGLRIVDLLSETWGVATRPGSAGKSTWFIVATG